MGEVAARMRLAPATVRMWETRHGFPRPRRLPGAPTRYSERDMEVLTSRMVTYVAGETR